MSAYEIVLSLHNILRWLVALAGLAAAGRALWGWLGTQPWRNLDKQLGLLFTVSMDVQLLLGLLLYFVLSPLTTENFSNFGEAMSVPDLRFYMVEHIFLMVVAVALAHIGRSLSRKAADDQRKHRLAAIFYTVAIVAVIAAIPWSSRPLLRLGG